MAHQDILEQIVEEYLTHQGYFVQHNVKYRPDKNASDYNTKDDSVASDIDVLAYHPKKSGSAKVLAVNVKSWYNGFRFESVISEIKNNKKNSGRLSSLRYRELAIPKWSKAFMDKIKEATGSDEFTHVLAVTRAIGEARAWEKYEPFAKALNNNPRKVLTLKDMVEGIEKKLTKTPAATDIGRTLQLLRASGLRAESAKPMLADELIEDPLLG